ncbi:MAG TPA: heavy metal translocating P-type ATPase [Polyangiaceae bacterium]|nr:heavy metal translocating P-type ATPase [Polyangiaceae bacterium]
MNAAERLVSPEAPQPQRSPASAAVTCSHCGLPVAGAPLDAPGPHFCCSACGLAYSLIHDAGLDAYYRERDARSRGARPNETGRTYAEYDDPAFGERHVRVLPEGARLELFLEGLHCTACVWLVERLDRVVPGVTSARLDLGRAALDVRFEPSLVRPSAIARALDGLGYPPHASDTAQREGEKRRERALWVRLGVAGALAGNVMLMALALYSGASFDPAYAALFRWGSFLLSSVSVFYCGSVFLRGALAAIRTRVPHMDLPVSIGILAGFARSAQSTVLARGDIYFDSISVLIFLLLVGRWLQLRHQRGAERALEHIAALAPRVARRVDGAESVEVPAEALAEGSVVEVRSGERFPVDGVIVAGHTTVDSGWLTGESLPEERAGGDRVYAGTNNCGSTVRVRVEVAGGATRLGRLLESVQAAQSRRAPIVRLADRVAGRFVFLVLGLSALTFTLWCFVDPARAVDNAVALLVVTCPCALGMATPLAVSAALRRAARAGIFFKGGEFLEALARPGTIAFDKTGTLTEGRLALASFVGDSAIVPLLRAAEARSSHPLGRALFAALPSAAELTADECRELPGAGIIARVAGHDVRIGSAEHVRERRAPAGSWWEGELERQAALGRPAVACAVDGVVRAVAAFDDPLRPDAPASLEALRALGYRAAVLSGDQQRVVSELAPRLGALVTARGKLGPEDKLAWVEAARRNGPVFMVGDGVNDAAAMAAADVAIAVHGGAEASLVAADAFTTEPGVSKVLEAVEGARRTLRVIRRGIGFSLAYNLVGVGLCMAGWVSPLIAAVLMPLSSLTVVTQALRARTFDAPRGTGRLS